MGDVGRNTKYTPDRVKRIVKAIADGNTHKVACALGGIHPDTFYTWIKEHAEFSKAVRSAEKESLRDAGHRQIVRGHAKRKATHKKGSGYVYLVHCEGTEYFKIGISKNDPATRLSSMQTGCPIKLHMLHVAHCDHFSYVENVLHGVYSSRRVRGEWFDMGGVEIDEMIDVMDVYATAQIGLF